MWFETLRKEVTEKYMALIELRAICTKVTSIITDMPHGGGGTKEDMYAKLADLSIEANADMDFYFEMRSVLQSAIDKIEDKTSRDLLTYRYMQGLSWAEVAKKMGKTQDIVKNGLKYTAYGMLDIDK